MGRGTSRPLPQHQGFVTVERIFHYVVFKPSTYILSPAQISRNYNANNSTTIFNFLFPLRICVFAIVLRHLKLFIEIP